MKQKKRGWRAMLWRRVIVLGLLSSLLSFLLTGCRPFQIMDGPGMEYHGGDNMPAEDSKPESVGKETPEKYVQEKLSNDYDAVTIAKDYIELAKFAAKKKKISTLTVHAEDIRLIVVDGTEYDLDALISHNMAARTEQLMEIDALFADGTTMEEVQAQINHLLAEK